ncbi:fluoride efflux transporter CrcB [Legionella fairfieldensis]|uniref:fluoride efflux transporter CrcB n=1 Tax=Legionella fairfieldensis TaxID=45064 RepID=UPI00048DEA57|nr:fluoride efflux transporter CrcB [Legionella fairfieldensis]
MWKSLVSITAGAALGALLRWQLGTRFNHLFPLVPPGTLGANLIGAYVVGLAIAYFAAIPTISTQWRLFIITGFCGGLTTFSTFAAEVMELIRQDRFAWSLGAIAIHITGSLLMVFAGMASWLGIQRLTS